MIQAYLQGGEELEERELRVARRRSRDRHARPGSGGKPRRKRDLRRTRIPKRRSPQVVDGTEITVAYRETPENEKKTKNCDFVEIVVSSYDCCKQAKDEL